MDAAMQYQDQTLALTVIMVALKGTRTVLTNLFTPDLKRQYPAIKSGTGVWLVDKDGRRYLDACGGAGVASIGHGVPEIKEAIEKQLAAVALVHGSHFVSEPSLELAQRLIELSPAAFNPGGLVYFTSGGAESVEAALKLARAYFYEIGLYQKSVVISRRGSYHGSTLAALALSGYPAKRKPYLPMLAAVPQISASNPYRCRCGRVDECDSEDCGVALADELEAAILKAGAEKVMAFIAEPVVGEALGAVRPHRGYFRRIREICDRYGVLLIADEVVTGMGRLGADFGLSLFGVEADIIALGNSLAAGYMPLGAVLASRNIASVFQSGTGVFEHGSNFSAHPVTCSAGLAVLNYLREHELLQRVESLQAKVAELLLPLQAAKIVGDVRGHGLLWGLEFVMSKETKAPFAPDLRVAQNVAAEAERLGLLVYPGTGTADGVKGDHIMLSPPFTISEAELGEMTQRLSAALKRVAQGVPFTSRI